MLIFTVGLIAFVLFIGASILWSTIAAGISPMPSSNVACQAILQLSDETGKGPIYELGCGWGGLLIRLAKKHPDRELVGYELSIIPWLTATVLKHFFRLKNVTLYRKNFLTADLSKASVIVCYLFPAGMKAIEEKLQCEKNNCRFLISNTFALSSRQPKKTIQLKDFYNSPVYFYHINSLI